MEKKEKEKEYLLSIGVLDYEAESESSKLLTFDTPYSILMEYLIERYNIDIFDSEIRERMLKISKIYKDQLLERDFNGENFQMEIKMGFS